MTVDPERRRAWDAIVVTPIFRRFVSEAIEAGFLPPGTDAGDVVWEWDALWQAPVTDPIRGDAPQDDDLRHIVGAFDFHD